MENRLIDAMHVLYSLPFGIECEPDFLLLEGYISCIIVRLIR